MNPKSTFEFLFSALNKKTNFFIRRDLFLVDPLYTCRMLHYNTDANAVVTKTSFSSYIGRS